GRADGRRGRSGRDRPGRAGSVRVVPVGSVAASRERPGSMAGVPNTPARIMESDDRRRAAPLSQARLAQALVRSGGFWSDVRVVAETGSTNADVMEAAA